MWVCFGGRRDDRFGTFGICVRLCVLVGMDPCRISRVGCAVCVGRADAWAFAAHLVAGTVNLPVVDLTVADSWHGLPSTW